MENEYQNGRSPIAGRLGLGSCVRTFGSGCIHHVLLEFRSGVATGECVLRDIGRLLPLADVVFRSTDFASKHEIAGELRLGEC